MKHDGWGDKLHKLIKGNKEGPGMHVRTLYNLCVPTVCRYNKKTAMLRVRFKEEKDPRLVVPAMNVEPYMCGEGLQPPWFMSSLQPTAHAGIFMNFHNDQVEPALADTSSAQPRLHVPPLARHLGLGRPTQPGTCSTQPGRPIPPALA
jgi:hypothetical protein